MIQEPVGDDLMREPLEVDGPTLPGAQEGSSTSLKGVMASMVPGPGIRWLTLAVPGLERWATPPLMAIRTPP